MKRITVKIFLLIFLPLFLLLVSVEKNAFNNEFYEQSFKENNIELITGKPLSELNNIAMDLMNYLKDKYDEEILESNFNEREIKHMMDVKALFRYGYILKRTSLIISIIIFLYYLLKKDVKSLGKDLFYGIFIWWGIILFLYVLSLSDFNKYFTYFHLIFFDNDLWILNPETDLLIQMLPQNFFIRIFQNIVLFFLCMLSIIQLTGYILMKKGKDRNGRIDKY